MRMNDFNKWLFDTANEQAEMYRKLNNLPDPDNEREGIKHGWSYPIGIRPVGISTEKWSAYRQGLNNLPVPAPAEPKLEAASESVPCSPARKLPTFGEAREGDATDKPATNHTALQRGSGLDCRGGQSSERERTQQPKGGDAALTSMRLEKSTETRLSTSDAAPNVQPAGAAPTDCDEGDLRSPFK